MSFSINGLFAALAVLPQLGTLVTNTVSEVESLAQQIPGFSGSQKLAAVVGKVNSFVSEVVTDAGALANINTILPSLINATVAMFNASGLFKHAAAPAPAPEPAA